MPRVFADTNVLFPFSLMDLLLALAEDYVHDLVLTDRLLDEWQRVIVRLQHRSESSAARIAAHIRAGFADAFVAEAEYKHLLAALDGPDRDDLHHAAAAVVGRADTVITWNLADFPADALAAHGIAVTKPDPYLCALSERYPDELRTTITHARITEVKAPHLSMISDPGGVTSVILQAAHATT